jgi:hypothetical protein
MTSIPVPIVDSGDYNYGAQIKLGNKIYCIRYQETADGFQKDEDTDDDAYQFSLVELVFDGTSWRSGDIAKNSERFVTLNANPFLTDRDYNGDVRAHWDAFLGRVNLFIQEAGVVDMTGFPENGTNTEKFEWLWANTQFVDNTAVVVDS